jgi:hypothetical protein
MKYKIKPEVKFIILTQVFISLYMWAVYEQRLGLFTAVLNITLLIAIWIRKDTL